VSELVKKARQSFRSSYGISQDNYVFYLAPGEINKEISFTFKYGIPGFE
jgi:hypothetical protein